MRYVLQRHNPFEYVPGTIDFQEANELPDPVQNIDRNFTIYLA
jgi:hypothetical protein